MNYFISILYQPLMEYNIISRVYFYIYFLLFFPLYFLMKTKSIFLNLYQNKTIDMHYIVIGLFIIFNIFILVTYEY